MFYSANNYFPAPLLSFLFSLHELCVLSTCTFVYFATCFQDPDLILKLAYLLCPFHPLCILADHCSNQPNNRRFTVGTEIIYQSRACTAKVITRVQGQERTLARASLLSRGLWGEPRLSEKMVHAPMSAVVLCW